MLPAKRKKNEGDGLWECGFVHVMRGQTSLGWAVAWRGKAQNSAGEHW